MTVGFGAPVLTVYDNPVAPLLCRYRRDRRVVQRRLIRKGTDTGPCNDGFVPHRTDPATSRPSSSSSRQSTAVITSSRARWAPRQK
jgi:hypothetical protein